MGWTFLWLYSLAGYVIMGGYLLFFVPGIIFTVWFAFAQFILVEEDSSAVEALFGSKGYVHGHWLDAFGRLFLAWLLSVAVGSVPLLGPLLSVAYGPFMVIFTFLLYKDLKSIAGETAPQTSSAEQCKWFAVGTLGYILMPLLVLLFIVSVLGVSLSMISLFLSSIMRQLPY